MSAYDSHKIQIVKLKELPFYGDYLKEIIADIPDLPSFNPNDPKHDENAWKYLSGMREGYIQAMYNILGEKNE